MEDFDAHGIYEWRKRKKGPWSIPEILCDRELGGFLPCAGPVRERQIYRYMCPNAATYNVDAPNVFFKRFSPDGKLLVGISRDQASVHVYDFHGSTRKRTLRASNMRDRCKRCKTDHVGRTANVVCTASQQFEKNLDDAVDREQYAEDPPAAEFADFFTLRHRTWIAKQSPSVAFTELLNRDFSLFTGDGNYVILASTEPSDTSQDDARLYPCSLVWSVPALEHVKFYTLNLHNGNVCGKLVLENDYVYLSHHAGVGLHNDMFAVVSVFHQCIRFFQIKPDGTFCPGRSIGWFNYEEEPLLLAKFQRLEEIFEYHSCQEEPKNLTPSVSDFLPSDFQQTLPYSGIKQRLLSFLYRRAVAANDGGAAVRYFFRTMAQYSSLVMSRMQFIDKDTILIRFGEKSVMTDRYAECTANSVFHMVYALRTTEVLAFYDNTSPELLTFFEQTADRLRGTASGREEKSRRLCGFDAGTICSNNLHARDALMKIKQIVTKARDGGPLRAARRVLFPLPFSPQSFSSSPYFDHSLFSYDEKVINASEKLKVLSEIPIKFCDRRTGKLRFRLLPGPGSAPQAVGSTTHSPVVPALLASGWNLHSPTSTTTGAQISQGSNFITAAVAHAISAGSTATPAPSSLSSFTSAASAQSSISASASPSASGSGDGGLLSAALAGDTGLFPTHASSKRLLQCIAHPREPFFIIIHHALTMPQIVNLHYYEP